MKRGTIWVMRFIFFFMAYVSGSAPAQSGKGVQLRLGHLMTDADALENLHRHVGVLERGVLVQAVNC